MNTIFIGMPVYNGEKFLSEAIYSLRNQTYSDWEMLISDNASEDGTEKICRQQCVEDHRIKYYRHEKNIGAVANFMFLLNQAQSEYFMWAASDDVWDHDFIRVCIINLEKNKKSNMAFCNIVNIDTYGRNIRDYPTFKRLSISNDWKRVINYLFDLEILGKANLIYSIYRLDFCKKIWRVCQLNNNWGSDMSFVLAAVARSNVIVNENVLFKKRYARLTDTILVTNRISIHNPYMYIFPLENSFQYIKDHLKAVKSTRFYWLTLLIMSIRYLNAIINFCIFSLSKVKYRVIWVIRKLLKL